MIPGEIIHGAGEIKCNVGRITASIGVTNTGDRPVQVGSHFHFFEVNRQLEFDRAKALGMRLNIAAGTAVRFEPGEEKEVELVALGGKQIAFGLNSLVDGPAKGSPAEEAAMQKIKSLHFKNKPA